MAFVGIYRAKFDYQPQTSEELEVRDGDLLFVLDKTSDDEWWTCKKKAEDDDDDEPEGLVPYNYVEEAAVLYQAKTLYEYSKQTDEELSFDAEQTVQVYDTTDPDWTLVGLRGSYGFVPAIYIEKAAASAPASAAGAAPAPPAMPPRPSADDGPLPGEADYPSPSSPGRQANTPAEQLANILAHKTGTGSSEPTATAQRALASPPLPSRNQVYTPEESEEDEAPPPKPARPVSQSISSPPQVASPVRSPKRSESQYIPSGTAEAPGIMPDYDEHYSPRSPGGYHLYNIHESITHMGKQKKLPMTLGINVLKGTIMISPEKSRDGPQQEWTAEKLTHYSIEGKHVFVELVRPSKSVDFHAGAKDTAQEIVAHLGELAGASRAEGLREVLAASQGSQYGGMKKGKMLYEFMAQGEDEVTVALDDEVIVLDESRSEEWWMVRRLKNGKEGVVPSSYVEITGTIPDSTQGYSGINAGRSTVEQNRLEEERLSKEAAKNSASARGIPERQSSLTPDASSSRRHSNRRSGGGKSKPNQSRIRTWTDRSGTFKVEAEFIGLREGKIHLHKLNGVKIAVPVTKMSVEDLEYVERATGASLDEDKPLSDIKRRSTQRAVNKAAGGAGATVVPKDHEYWFDFFLQCGVNPQICERYAQAFSKDQMSQEVLPEVNASLLRTLGLKEGDILRVMKFLDNKFNRERSTVGGGENGTASGLFSGPGGTLKNNTSKGRPAPAVQTNDMISEDAFKPKDEAEAKSPTAGEGAQKTILASAPAREPKGGFDDDAWAPKPSRTQTPDAASRSAPPTDEAKKVEELTARPRVNDDIASLSITSPPLQPTVAPPPHTAPSGGISPAQSPPPQLSHQPPGANKDIFDKIASLAPARQRPQPPPQQQAPGGALSVPPPPRASSAPGFSPQNTAFGNVAPLQAQLTGYQPQLPQYGQQPGLQPQQTAFQYGAPPGFQPNGYPQQQPQMPQVTGIQAIQQNYPALQPQPTGLNFQPQSQFGQQSQAQHYGPPQSLQQQQQQQYQQQLINGAQSSASPFADPPRQPYQPGIGSGLSQSFTAQQTGYQPQQQQPNFNISQPTGLNGFQPQPPSQLPNPNLPPQQTGGVFGPSQPLGLGAPPAPLVPQKTGPPPPVRFGVKPGEKKLVPQPTGRANLAKATPQNPFGF